MKRKNSGFSIVELITVIVIISILVSLLLPGISMVRNLAKNTEQKAQFTALKLALEAFKNDYGQYPESSENPAKDYQGAQKLAEAMVGRDMLGFHPSTDWGNNGNDYLDYYRGLDNNFKPSTNKADKENLDKRRDLYLELESSNVFRLQSDPGYDISGLYSSSENTQNLADDSLVLCDVYKRNKVVSYLSFESKMIKAGNPILYYRANLQSKDSYASATKDSIYNAEDNFGLIKIVSDVMKNKHGVIDRDLENSFYNNMGSHHQFYGFIADPKVAKPNESTSPLRYWPYNSKTYILISAGRDGLYGTEDDICNFDR